MSVGRQVECPAGEPIAESGRVLLRAPALRLLISSISVLINKYIYIYISISLSFYIYIYVFLFFFFFYLIGEPPKWAQVFQCP